MEKFVQVALKVTHNNGVFTYRLCDGVSLDSCIGKRVKVTIKNRLETGVIVDEAQHAHNEKFVVKDVIEIIDDQPILTSEQLSLMRFCANYYFNSFGQCVHLGIPRDEKSPREIILHRPIASEPSTKLTDEQQQAVTRILATKAGAYLVEGVTGSGKTHVYVHVAYKTLQEGRAVLILVPEISLTPQLVKRVEEALQIKALVMHSNISPAKKRDATFALLAGKANLLIGARSALFAPLPNLGLIVVDEEHDGSLKQDEAPRYHARDLALWRARNEKARIILGSATPSLESFVNAQTGKLTHLFLQNRFNKNHHPLPEVTVIDLKERARDVDHRNEDLSASSGQKMCILSRPLIAQMHVAIKNNQQIVLFLNQRGYAKFGVCYQCGNTIHCPSCSVGLTYYQHRRALVCHQCQHTEVAQTICRHCHHDAVRFLGVGTERLEEEVRTIFPEQIVMRLDRDIVRSQRRLEETLNAMHEQRAHILIGTQMIAKGHDFLHVGLVGVVCADVALSMPDFRASEKTFQLLTQVAGRAGRGDTLGQAIIQTFNPTHPSIKYAKTHNVNDFVKEELSLRKQFFQPPFSRAALLRAEHSDAMVTEDFMLLIKKFLTPDKKLSLLGPVPSPIEKISNRHRFQCLIMSGTPSHLHQALERLSNDQNLSSMARKKRIRFIIDVDPQNLI